MSMQITHIRFGAPTKSSEFIDWLRWRNDTDGSDGEAATSTLVRWITNGGDAHVGSGANKVSVRVVHTEGREPFLQTYVGDRRTDDLCELPEF